MLVKSLSKVMVYIILIIPFLANGEIIKVDNLQQISDKFTQLYKDYNPNDILLVVGVKKVVFKSHLPDIRLIDNEVMGSLYKMMFQTTEFSKVHYFDTVLLTEYDNELLDSRLPDFIKSITDKGSPVILNDAGLTGNFNNIKNLEVWKDEYFKKFGIDLVKSFPDHEYIVFNNMKPFDNTYPVFYRGILSSNIASTFQLITNFLAYTKYTPKVLVVIDSNYVDLNSVETQINNYDPNMLFVGYDYIVLDQQGAKFDKIAEIRKFMQAFVEKVNKVKRNNPPLKAKSEDESEKKRNPYNIKK
jgi:hypothetical protein